MRYITIMYRPSNIHLLDKELSLTKNIHNECLIGIIILLVNTLLLFNN